MCGIAGIAGQANPELVREMTRRLAHRGPDDEGFHSEDGATLGHRRLSIIDLSMGKQPISNEDGTVWITFNGEIYNFKGLRADLEAKGHRFATNTDTEAIVHAYEEYGEDCVSRLYGMFAFGIWDSRNKTLFLARDHAGVKPLYYAEVNGHLLFASEIKAILAHDGISKRIDYQAFDDYFTYLYTVPPRTIYQDIRQLPPAHSLTWRDGKTRIRKYWHLDMTPEHHTEAEWNERIRDCLEEVIQSNMIADVPLGAFLSGGLDSGTIVAMMARASTDPVRTFTIGFGKEGNLYDETAQAKEVAEYFNTEHHLLEAHPDVVSLLPTVVSHFDEPFGNPTAFLVYILSKLIREHVTVALAGDGGDESFGGYARYAGAQLAGKYRRLPGPLRRYLINPLVHLLPESTRGNHTLRRIREFSEGSLLEPADMYASWVTYFTAQDRQRLYTESTQREVGAYDSLDYLRGLFEESRDADFVSQTMYVDLKSFMPNNVLHYSDRMSMAHALEIRVPYTDPRIMELMARVPSALKVKGMETKCSMRKAMTGLLPESVVARKKLGFNPPMGVWLTSTLEETVEDCLSETTIRKRGYFNPTYVRGLIDAHRASRRDYTWHIWSLIFFEQWHRMYLD